MKNEIIENYVLYNDKPVNKKDFDYELTKSSLGVYEVIRIIDGVPLFLEKHLKRFKESSNLLGFELKISDDNIANSIKKLIDLNKCNIGNIKIVINNIDNKTQDVYMFFIESKYPTYDEIQKGVPVILYKGERNNPNAKSTDLSFRENVNAQIAKHSAYEALLVNSKDEITEGSKSNVFLVKSKTIYTPPVTAVLPGVTRGYVIEICKDLKIDLIEEPVKLSFLKDMDGLFITGTSPKVLPVSSVDGMKFNSPSNSIIIKIREAYDNILNEYIASHK